MPGARTVSWRGMSHLLRSTAAGALLAFLPSQLQAQAFDAAGTRAQGMAGAFVAVANDASAVYWNPGALASGAYFSLVFDRTSADATLDEGAGGGQSSWLLALAAPVVGLSYYRLRQTMTVPVPAIPEAPMSGVESLVTHHLGATLVQSLTDNIAVGATVKLVRGIATVGSVPAADADDLLDSADDLPGRSTNRADVDAGILATTSLVRVGFVVRNIAEPGFDTSTGEELHLKRQARAGVSVVLTNAWLLAADVDLTRNEGPIGDDRAFALGAEGRVLRRAFARAGVRLNTAGGDLGTQPAVTFGGTYAATGSVLIDAQVTTGSDEALRGWGIAGRIIF
jgi:hypothetical protein